MSRVRLTRSITIDMGVWERANRLARDEGVSFSRLVEQNLAARLEEVSIVEKPDNVPEAGYVIVPDLTTDIKPTETLKK